MENIKEELIKKIEDMKTTDSDTSKMSTIGASYYDEALDDVIELVKNHGVSHHVSGCLPDIRELSNKAEDAIEKADSSTDNWYQVFQDELQKRGLVIIKPQ